MCVEEIGEGRGKGGGKERREGGEGDDGSV